jgi:hypothetical protein
MYKKSLINKWTLQGITATLFCVFTLAGCGSDDDGPAPAVTGVTVNAAAAGVVKGGTLQFSATVAGTNSPAQTVTWSITGDHNTATTISDAGLLTVAAAESSNSLTVRATSTADVTKYGEKTVAADNVIPEPVTVTAAESVDFLPGKGRVLARVRLNNATDVRTVVILWTAGNVRDSISLAVTPAAGRDSVETIITLDEGEYVFDVVTKDADGNRSATVAGTGSSHGDGFRSGLQVQGVETVDLTSGQAEITWQTAPANHIGNEVRYSDVNNETLTLYSETGTATTVLPLAQDGSTFEYRSFFKPAVNAIDTFRTAWTKYETAFPELPKVELDKSIMSIVKLDSDSDWGGYGGLAEGLIDGVTVTTGSDNGAFGHTYTGGLPAAVTVDLGQTTKLSSIVLYQHRSADVAFTWVNTKHFDVYGREAEPSQSGDWSEWTKVVECEVVPPTSGNLVEIANAGVAFRFPANMAPVRYVRINVTQSFDSESMGGITHVAEFSFYKRDE